VDDIEDDLKGRIITNYPYKFVANNEELLFIVCILFVHFPRAINTEKGMMGGKK
jgi:hypothetical protein